MSDLIGQKPFTHIPGKRSIRSFVLRQGRFTPAQQRAFDDLWPRFGIDFETSGLLDLDAIFGRQAPRVMEIGFGNGDALRYAAAQDRDRDYIGIEVHAPGVGHLLNALNEDASTHVRILHHDAVEVLAQRIADHSLDEVRIYFPDPWHKKRHHKRRLIQTPFVQLLTHKLRIGGLLHLATDWQNYAEHMRHVLDQLPELRNLSETGDYVPRPTWRPETRFERRGLKLGHAVFDLLYRLDGVLPSSPSPHSSTETRR